MCNCNKDLVETAVRFRSKYAEEFSLYKKWILDQKDNKIFLLEAIRDSDKDIVGYIGVDDKGQTHRFGQHLIKKVLK